VIQLVNELQALREAAAPFLIQLSYQLRRFVEQTPDATG
jgi:hypothetical protein